MPSLQQRPAAERALPVAFVAAWALGCAFYLGNLGWWGDDWFFCMRSAADGSVSAWQRTQLNPVSPDPAGAWRPLHNIITPTLITLTWHANAVAHLLQALIWACAALTLRSLLVELHASRRAGWIAAILFVTFPFAYEAIFWVAALPTALALLLLLLVILLTLRAAGPQGTWKQALVASVLACAVPLLNEQPAAALAALPVLGAIRLKGQHPRPAHAIARVACVTAVAGAACAAYVAALALAPGAGLGSGGQLLPLRELPDAAGDALSDVAKGLYGLGMGGAGLALARAALTQHVWLPAGCAGALLLILCLALRTALSPSAADAPKPPRSVVAPVDRACLAGVCVLVPLLSCVPFIAVGAGMLRPRFLATPLVGVCAALALLAAALLASQRPAVRRLTCLALILLACAGATSLLGVQHAYRLAHAMDRTVMRGLARLAPPASDPPTPIVVLIVQDDSQPVRTGRWRFDASFFNSTRGSLYSNWAVHDFARWALRRDDAVTLGALRFPDPRTLSLRDVPVLALSDETPAGSFIPLAPVRWSAPGRAADGSFPWTHALPITISPEGDVSLVTTLSLTDSSGHTVTLSPPAAHAAAQHCPTCPTTHARVPVLTIRRTPGAADPS